VPILIRNLYLDLDEPEEDLVQKAAARLGVAADGIRNYAIVRRSLDARDKDRIRFAYNMEAALADGAQFEQELVAKLARADVSLIKPVEPAVLEPGEQPLCHRPVVVGFGPAGMFAALLLAEYGYRPVILERGKPAEQRAADVQVRFFQHGQFDSESNVVFGEGGAGAFSDGKLHTRVNDPRVEKVLRTFYQSGAPPEILIEGKPHIGSDKLPAICAEIRRRIEKLGGEVRFDAKVTDLVRSDDGRVERVVLADGTSIEADLLILATGQNARDVYLLLSHIGITLQAKPFQMGVRIQHPQEMVNRWQYGTLAGHPKLPPADYRLVAKGAAGKRSEVFSFCMCPGGYIVPANESPHLVITNGASDSGRSGSFANSGLVLTIRPEEFGNDPLAGVELQKKIEIAAFNVSGSYAVPAQNAPDFLAGRKPKGRPAVEHPFGSVPADLREFLPKKVVRAVRRALRTLDRRLRGFAGPEAVIVAPETRASSPVRIPRDPDRRRSVSCENLYPVGEGAGYAGGIVSAAVDGLKTAEAIIRQYGPPK